MTVDGSSSSPEITNRPPDATPPKRLSAGDHSYHKKMTNRPHEFDYTPCCPKFEPTGGYAFGSRREGQPWKTTTVTGICSDHGEQDIPVTGIPAS